MGLGDYFTPRIRKIGGYCFGTFIVGYAACYGMYRITQTRLIKAPHCDYAFQILCNHKDAVKALGEPIGVNSNLDFRDHRCYRVNNEKKTFWVKVPVSGVLDRGHLYVNGVFENDEVFQVTTMDLSLERLEKKFRIYELPYDEITVGKKLPKSKDEEEENDDAILTSLEKRKWFDFGWLRSNA